MIKLLVIADDFTGALDTGVQFRAKNTLIRVWNEEKQNPFADLNKPVQVLIIDAETRHLPAAEAYRIVESIVSAARQEGVPCIYKKTDSGLRGNVGSELTAMLRTCGCDQVHFIPAFPRMNRTTESGVHYIDGVPVAQSVFGKDPFEPVHYSSVEEIITSQCDVPVRLMGTEVPAEIPCGILVYDSRTEAEMLHIATELKAQGQLHMISGCAGFAMMLPDLLELEQADNNEPFLHNRLQTICGSVNPITMGQLAAAEKAGVPRVCLTPQQKLDPAWIDSTEGKQHVQQWMEIAQSSSAMIIECGGEEVKQDTMEYAAQHGMGLEDVRLQISTTMGAALRRLLDAGLESTLLVTGGDTLLAFMRAIRQDELSPLRELVPGVVLSRIEYQGKQFDLLSKSGGFGEQTLLKDLEKMIAEYNLEKM